ncbi:MAG: ATP-binding protein [Terrimicrobiaceae bacterium]
MSESPSVLREAYERYDCHLRARYVIVADVVALVCMPAGIVLDYFVYPSKIWEFLLIRLAVDLILAAFVFSLLAGKNRTRLPVVKTLGVLSTLVVNLSFCVMIYLTEGAVSPYYAGLNLVILIMATLLPWTAFETALVCVLSLVFYTLACFAHAEGISGSAFSIFFNNSYFVTITAVICVTSTYFRSKARFDEFELRHQLDGKNRTLQDMDRAKTQFFSNISHELRTPLTLILGPVETLLSRGENLDARVHEGLILVHGNALRLLKLINDLLDLMRLEQGAEVLRKRNLSLGAFLRGIVDSVKHLGLSKSLKIRVEKGDEEDEMLADPARMEKVVLNLLTNAIKYTPVSGTITVRWDCTPEEARIEVADTGVGIPAGDLAKIFDRFHQVGSNSSNQFQGVGIGLALAKDLVTEHGGRIEVESVVGKGSTFRVVLPHDREAVGGGVALSRDAGPEEPFEKAFRSADRTWRNIGGDTSELLPVVGDSGEIVLVADDERDMLQYIVSLLSSDYRVVQTRNGGMVRELVEQYHPRVVLLDWMMPGRDGLSLCGDLRADASLADLKIMLLTARIDEESKIQALRAGADDFLTKPFSTAEVKTRVLNLLRSSQLQIELRVRNAELSETLEKLQRTETLLIQSEKMNALGSLSAGILHEINNPLNYTLTAVSFAKKLDAGLSPEIREILADIEEGMQRVRDVITHLKDFAYPEKPGTETIFSLREVFDSARKILSNEIAGADMEVEIPETLLVRGQKTQITHVFMNLLSNAGKAVAGLPPDAGKRISVDATASAGAVTVSVSDSGPGIPDAILGRVFEPFFTTREVGSGMGMGLSICHTIMEAHGGTIGAGNKPGGGAVFTFTLPLPKPPDQTL